MTLHDVSSQSGAVPAAPAAALPEAPTPRQLTAAAYAASTRRLPNQPSPLGPLTYPPPFVPEPEPEPVPAPEPPAPSPAPRRPRRDVNEALLDYMMGGPAKGNPWGSADEPSPEPEPTSPEPEPPAPSPQPPSDARAHRLAIAWPLVVLIIVVLALVVTAIVVGTRGDAPFHFVTPPLPSSSP